MLCKLPVVFFTLALAIRLLIPVQASSWRCPLSGSFLVQLLSRRVWSLISEAQVFCPSPFFRTYLLPIFFMSSK